MLVFLLTIYYLIMLNRKRWCLRKMEEYPIVSACVDFEKLEKDDPDEYQEYENQVGFFYLDPIDNNATVRPIRQSGRLVCFCEYQFQKRDTFEKLSKFGTFD